MLNKARRWWKHVRARGQLAVRARELMQALGDPAAGQVPGGEIRTLIMQIGVAHLEGLHATGWRYDQTTYKEGYH